MRDQHEILNSCIDAWREGRREECEALVGRKETGEVRDSGFHLAWADLLEEMGRTDLQLQELHLAVRDDPGNRLLYARLAEVYLDQGRADRAAHCWTAYIKQHPEDPEAYRQLAQLFRESGDHSRALQVLQEGQERTGDTAFAPLLRELRAATAEESEPAPVAAGDQIIPAQHHLVTFTALFSSREGVYARQWVSPTGEGGYTPVHEPLTLKVAENHMLGNHTIGVYPVRMDNTVNFLAFDLDMAKFAVNKNITSQQAWNQAMKKLHGVACKLVDLGAAHDLPFYLEDSGFKGRHVWLFLETPVPAGVAKKCGDLLCAQLGPLPPEVVIEVFPKQTRVNPGALGNLIKLPLGYHKKTGRRSLFLQPDGSPYPDQLGFLQELQKGPRRAVYALIQRVAGQKSAAVPSLPVGEPAPTDERPPWETPPAEPKPGPAPLPAEDYDLERDVQAQYLFSRCPVLRAIMDRVNQAGVLNKDETLVLIHTFGHLDNGPRAVNQILQRCIHVEPSLLMKSPLRGNPMSCPKIRSRVPHISSSVACNCSFDPNVNLYPTPLIHILSMKKEPVSHPLGITLDSMHFQQLLQQYLKLRQQAQEVALLLQRVEAQLKTVFEEAGVSSVRTPLGELQQVQKEDGQTAFTLNLS